MILYIILGILLFIGVLIVLHEDSKHLSDSQWKEVEKKTMELTEDICSRETIYTWRIEEHKK